MDPREAEDQRIKLWQAVQAGIGQHWPLALADVIQFAGQADDPMVRCGRLDVVTYILDSMLPHQEV